MNTPPPSIFLGDYVRAVQTLQPAGGDSPDTCAAIARLLGFQLDASGPGQGTPRPPPPHVNPGTPAARRPLAKQKRVSRPDPPPPVDEPAWVPSVLETRAMASAASDPDDFLAHAKSLAPGRPSGGEGPPVEPLLVPRWTRGILHVLAATAREGELDVERLVERVGRAEPLARLPRRAWPTLRRGLRVLLDVGPGMMPFAADTRWLLDRLREVVGPERTWESVFVGGPWRGPLCDGMGVETGPWSPPPAGTPVLVVGDLGACRKQFPLESASEADWLEFARGVRRAGCPLIAMTPGAPTRYPSALRRALVLIPWDRRTTAGRLRRQFRRDQPVSRSSHE